MSKNVKFTPLTAKVRENFAQKMSQESRNFFFETGRIKPFQRTRARFQAASTRPYNKLFLKFGQKRPLRRGLKCHLSNLSLAGYRRRILTKRDTLKSLFVKIRRR